MFPSDPMPEAFKSISQFITAVPPVTLFGFVLSPTDCMWLQLSARQELYAMVRAAAAAGRESDGIDDVC